jgi:outer membrane immunogenic protein
VFIRSSAVALIQHAAAIVTTASIHRLRDFIMIAILQLTRAMGVGMKKIMLAGVGAALKAPTPAVPAFSWTGCYIGGNIGGGWGREAASAPFLAPGISVTGDTSGVIGGGQIGCNYRFAPNWVIGIEGDGSAAIPISTNRPGMNFRQCWDSPTTPSTLLPSIKTA